MNDIWTLEADISSYMKFAAASTNEYSPIIVTHHVTSSEVTYFRENFHRSLLRNRPTLAATLILTLENFDADYFNWGGTMFASERMRDAMALGWSEVRFFEIDDSRSAALPRMKSYQIMEPVVTEDVSDPAKSDYKPGQLMPDGSVSPRNVYSIALRPGATPEHDLFYDRFFDSHLFCTEALAARVLKTGCTGVSFAGPPAAGGPRLYRTRAGIEERVWDPVNRVEITRVTRNLG
jgi:hypothetical protein